MYDVEEATHRHWLQADSAGHRRDVALGAGECSRYLNSMRPDHPPGHIVCRCGEVDLGRVHLTWECPFRTTQNLRDPVAGVERELLLPLVPRYPVAERRALGQEMQSVVMELRRVQAAHPGARIRGATDGGSNKVGARRIGSWAVVVGNVSVSGAVPGFDQSAPAAEQWAALQAAWALNEASVTQAWLIIDNLMTVNRVKGTIAGIGRDHTDYYALWRSFAALTSRIDLRCDHIPSQGKQPNWRPPNGEDVALWRRMNKSADAAASEMLTNLCFAAQGQARERHAAKRWSHSAMLAQVARIEELHSRYPPDPNARSKKAQRKRAVGGFGAIQDEQMLSEAIRAGKRRRRPPAKGTKRTSDGAPHQDSNADGHGKRSRPGGADSFACTSVQGKKFRKRLQQQQRDRETKVARRTADPRRREDGQKPDEQQQGKTRPGELKSLQPTKRARPQRPSGAPTADGEADQQPEVGEVKSERADREPAGRVTGTESPSDGSARAPGDESGLTPRLTLAGAGHGSGGPAAPVARDGRDAAPGATQRPEGRSPDELGSGGSVSNAGNTDGLPSDCPGPGEPSAGSGEVAEVSSAMPVVCGRIEHPYSRAEVTPGAPASEESDRPGADPRPDDDGGAAQPSPQRVDLKTDSDEDDESEHSFEGCWTTLAENPEMLHGNRGDEGPPGRRAPPLVSVAQPSRPRERVRKKIVQPGTTARPKPSGKARRTAATTRAPRGAAIPTPTADEICPHRAAARPRLTRPRCHRRRLHRTKRPTETRAAPPSPPEPALGATRDSVKLRHWRWLRPKARGDAEAPRSALDPSRDSVEASCESRHAPRCNGQPRRSFGSASAHPLLHSHPALPRWNWLFDEPARMPRPPAKFCPCSLRSCSSS